MAVQVEDGRDRAGVLQSQHDGAAGPGAEGRGGVDGEARGPRPAGVGRAERDIEPQGAFQVERLRQAIRRERLGRRQRRALQPAGNRQAPDLLRLLTVVEQESGRCGRIHEGIGARAGASTRAPLRAGNGSAGWPSRAMIWTS